MTLKKFACPTIGAAFDLVDDLSNTGSAAMVMSGDHPSRYVLTDQDYSASQMAGLGAVECTVSDIDRQYFESVMK